MRQICHLFEKHPQKSEINRFVLEQNKFIQLGEKDETSGSMQCYRLNTPKDEIH